MRPLTLIFLGLLISQMVDRNTQVLIILRAAHQRLLRRENHTRKSYFLYASARSSTIAIQILYIQLPERRDDGRSG